MKHKPVIRFSFTSREIRFARDFGARRNKSKGGGVVTASGRDAIRDEAVGVLGEMAVGKLLGQHINTEIYEGGDDGVDFRYKGVTIDAKCTEYINGVLVFDEIEKFRSDVAFFVIVTYNDRDEYGRKLPVHQHTASAKSIGWLSKRQFIANCVERKIGREVRVVVPQELLNPVETFYQYDVKADRKVTWRP